MEDSEIDEHERTKHREAISREVDEVVEARLRDRQPVKRDWVIQEILSRHPLPDSLEPTKRDFLLWCAKLIVGEEVDPILVCQRRCYKSSKHRTEKSSKYRVTMSFHRSSGRRRDGCCKRRISW